MPYVSDAQRRFMHARHPEIAKRWDRKYDTPKRLPERKSHEPASLRGLRRASQ